MNTFLYILCSVFSFISANILYNASLYKGAS
nr:MAG TPA: hypothetical protein [Caudoviricetes sp.]